MCNVFVGEGATLIPIDSMTTCMSNSMSCVLCVAAASSASVTESATLCYVLLQVLMGDPLRNADVPFMLLRVSVSFAESESEQSVTTNLN
jgi:hypothetical protein